MAVILLALAIATTVDLWRGNAPADATAGTAVVMWIFFAIPAWFTWKLRPRRVTG